VLPPDLRDWLPEGHLELFLADVVQELDLSALYRDYGGDGRGQPPYDPRMMLTVLLYAYCIGKPSSRAIERATHEDVAFRVLAANQHPDHDTVCEFRRRHLKSLAGLFLQVMQLCAAAGPVKLGRVVLDGTKVKANASKHKAMSNRRMLEREQEFRREIDGLLREAEATLRREDALHGPGRCGDELPHELARRATRLKRIQEAREALEAQGREEPERRAAEAQAKSEEGDRGGQPRGRGRGRRGPRVPDVAEVRPDDKA
jgi:transposase